MRTCIQSGNVIFEMASRSLSKLSSDITESILQKFGFSPKVMLLTAAELQSAIARNYA